MKHFLLIALLVVINLVQAQIPVNYYQTTENLSGTTLQSELHSIIDNHTVISYSQLWNAYSQTDLNSNGKIWDMYSYNPTGSTQYEYTPGTNQCGGNYSSEGDCYNREHSFPQSWFNEQSPMVSDLFQIYPTDGYVNNQRGNYPYGETNAPTWTSTNGSKLGPCSNTGYTGVVFEPIDEFKGDFARTMLYMATRYYNEDSNWPGSSMTNGAQPKEWAITVLINWHKNDPVSTKEINRNNAVYQIQHNRNPFIDHPEYANYIWGSEAPDSSDKPLETPTNHVSNFSSSSITLNWTDATGSNSPTGYLVLMSAENFANIPVPTDGTSPASYANSKVVMQGKGTCTFSELEKQKTYYFKIYPFSGNGSSTDYKTNGTIPQTTKTTE